MDVSISFDARFAPAIAAQLDYRAVARFGLEPRGRRKNTTIRRAGKAQVGDTLVLTVAGSQTVIGLATCLAVTPLQISPEPATVFDDGRRGLIARFVLGGQVLSKKATELLINRDTAGQMEVDGFVGYMIERVGPSGLDNLALYIW